jgi:hypothetical protein
MIRETAVGGGVSDPFRLEVLPPRPVPVLEGIDPERMEVADPSTEYLSIEAIGSGFDRVSVVEFEGVPLETSFLSETRLRARLPSEFILDGGSFPITVVTRAPGGGTTNRAVLTVENPAPVIETLSPHFHRVRSDDHLITIDGEGFVPGTRVALDGQECVTRWIDPSRLEVVPPRFETLASTVLELSNTTPGGGRDSTRVEVIDTWTLPFEVHDAVYDAPRSRLLVTGLTDVPADRLAAIDPFGGTILSSVYVGTDPRVLALSDDTEMLYIGLDGLGAGRQYEARTDQPGLVFEFGDAETGKLRADDMYVLPGRNESLVVALKGFGGNFRNAAVFVFDDGVRRPQGTSPVSGTNRIARVDDRTLVAFRNTLDDDRLWRMTIDAGGVTAETLQRDLYSGLQTDIWSANGLVFHTKGTVVDAASLTTVATFPVWGPVLAEEGTGAVICVSNSSVYPLSPPGVFVYEIDEFWQVGHLDTSVRAGDVRKVLRLAPDTIGIVHEHLIEIIQSRIFEPARAGLPLRN